MNYRLIASGDEYFKLYYILTLAIIICNLFMFLFPLH